MSPRFVARTKADRGRMKAVPEADRVTVTARTVVLTCGCKTRKEAAVTFPGGVNKHWCCGRWQRERR